MNQYTVVEDTEAENILDVKREEDTDIKREVSTKEQKNWFKD